MKGTWDPIKKSYVTKKKENPIVNWIHKNVYVRIGKVLYKGKNKPYVKATAEMEKLK